MPTFMKVEVEKKVKRIRGKKEKDWTLVEDEYLRGANEVLAMTGMERVENDDSDSDFDESDFKVVCTVCNKEFNTSAEASEHFWKKH